MQHLEVSGAVRPLKWSLGVKWLNPTCHLLALLGIHHILHVSRIGVKRLNMEILMAPRIASECNVKGKNQKTERNNNIRKTIRK